MCRLSTQPPDVTPASYGVMLVKVKDRPAAR
jgi:hypothetical protein